MIKKIALVLAGLIGTPSLAGVKLPIDLNRALVLAGEITPRSAVEFSAVLLKVAAEDSQAPIQVVINSPGGSVDGLGIIIDTMDAIKSRGISIDCLVQVYAASAAFSVFDNCSNRYTFKHSKLLFHPASGSLPRVTEQNAEEAYVELARINAQLRERLLASMGMNVAVFDLAFRQERFWTAKDFIKAVRPGYMTIIEDAPGLNVITMQ